MKFALHRLLKHPSFTAVAALTQGTGGQTPDGSRFKPKSSPHLVTARRRDSSGSRVTDDPFPGGISICNDYERRDAISAFASGAMNRDIAFIVGEGNESRRVETGRVTPGFFRTIGFPLATGREFTDEELDFQTGYLAILTGAFWQSYSSGGGNRAELITTDGMG